MRWRSARGKINVPLLPYPARTDVVFRRIQDNPDVIPSFLTLLQEGGMICMGKIHFIFNQLLKKIPFQWSVPQLRSSSSDLPAEKAACAPHPIPLSSHSRRKAKAKFLYRSMIPASCQLFTGLPGHCIKLEGVDASLDLWPNLCIARWISGNAVNGQTEATTVVEKAREKAIHFCVVSLAENRFPQY